MLSCMDYAHTGGRDAWNRAIPLKDQFNWRRELQRGRHIQGRIRARVREDGRLNGSKDVVSESCAAGGNADPEHSVERR